MGVLDLIAGWTRFARADGAELVGPAGGAITITSDVHPIPTLRALFTSGGDAAIGPTACERLVTLDGELGAIASVTSELTSWTIAIVAGDRAASVVSGRGPRSAGVEAIVRALAEHTYLGLPPVRRRRFVFTPPPGWLGLPRPHAVRYLHPALPRRPHALTVYDARPVDTTAPELADRLLLASSSHGRRLDPPRPLAPIRSAAGLEGEYVRIDTWERGDPFAIVRCTLRDRRFRYVAELAAPRSAIAEELPALEAVVASIEPLPEPRTTDLGDRALYWGD